MAKLELKDLVSALSGPSQNQLNNTTQQFLGAPTQKIKSLPLREQLRIKKESTYRTTQQEMDKWIGIVKLNREKSTLNLVQKDKDNAASVSFFPAVPISDLHKKIEGKLQMMQVHSQQAVMKQEEHVLTKLSREEAKQRLKEARKQRTLHFNEEVKRRRISKIKSKLYHKIKKRQKTREQVQRVSQLGGEQKQEYNQKLVRQRIKERVTLRHRSKGKHIQNLLRFSKNNQQTIQDSLNQVNAIRHQQLQKVNEEYGDLSQDLDQENYKNNLSDLQHQIDQLQKELPPQKGLDSMKFMIKGRQAQITHHKQDARAIAKILAQDNQIDGSEGQMEVQEREGSVGQEQEITRKSLGQNSKTANLRVKTTGNFIGQNLKRTLGSEIQLTEGINVNRLKQKYQPQRGDMNLTEAIQLQRDNISKDDVVEQNYKEFQQQKQERYQAEIREEPKKTKGWGSWAGPGISEPKVDYQAQVRKKIAKIEEIKRKRRDGQMAGVIVRQTYNKQLKDYFVNKLPHKVKTPEQFNYLQNQPVGPQWNSLTQFKANIKPKVLTQAGQVIESIRMPKTLGNNKK